MTFNDLCIKLFDRPWSDGGKSANPTIGSGVALVFILGALMMVPGAVPVSIIAMDLIGEQAQGRIIARRDAWFSQRSATVSVYRFRTADGRSIRGEGAFEGDPLPGVGSAVTVRYLPIWPEGLSKYGHHHYTHWGFWLLTAFFVPLFWMWIRVILTTGRLIGDKFR
jgi:hypothetical protein